MENQANHAQCVPIARTGFVPEVRSQVFEGRLTVTQDDLPINIRFGQQTKMHITIKEAIKERYNQTAHIVLDKECWPDSYSYTADKEEAMSLSNCYPVIRRPPESWFCPPAFDPETLVWLKLNQEEKNKLLTILLTGICIRNFVYYDTGGGEWKSRIRQPPEEFPDIFRSLKFTRAGDEQTEYDVLSELTNGRTKEEMTEILDSPFNKFMSENLEQVWTSALVSGITNDEGQLAVYTLLNFIFQTLQGLDMTIPPIKFVTGTSSTPEDCVSIVSCSSTDSTSDGTPSVVKRRKLDDQANKRKDGRSDEPKTEKSKSGVRSGLQSGVHQHYGDLSVVTQDSSQMFVATQDDVNGVAKYLIVIAIRSKGKPEKEVKQKLMQEMIFVLQRQNKVFGLLFEETRIHLYKAEKDNSGAILFFSNTYSLLDIFCTYGTFRVSSFQSLILDIFTCIVYGLKHIHA